MFWTTMLLGNLAVVVGVLVSTLGAGFLFADDAHKRAVVSRAGAFGAVVLGTLIATGGGLSTTYAWNLSSTAETRAMLAQAEADRLSRQREAIADQALVELGTNVLVIDSAQFGETSLVRIREHGVIPSLASESITTIVTSGLFVGPEELDVYHKALELREQLRQAEAVTGQLRAAVILSYQPSQPSSELVASIREAPVFQQVRQGSEELGRALGVWRATIKTADQSALVPPLSGSIALP